MTSVPTNYLWRSAVHALFWEPYIESSRKDDRRKAFQAIAWLWLNRTRAAHILKE